MGCLIPDRAAPRPRVMTEELPEYDLTLYPDPLPRKPSEPVISFDEDISAPAEGMLQRMHASNGVGLAAPQVGVRTRVLVMNPTGEEGDDRVLINPEILERDGGETTYEEGCLSFPGVYAEVRRPDRCKVRFFSVDGKEHEEEFTGFTSRVIQHEYDHLEGVLLVDRMSPADKVRNKPVLQDLVARYQERRKREESTA